MWDWVGEGGEVVVEGKQNEAEGGEVRRSKPQTWVDCCMVCRRVVTWCVRILYVGSKEHKVESVLCLSSVGMSGGSRCSARVYAECLRVAVHLGLVGFLLEVVVGADGRVCCSVRKHYPPLESSYQKLN